jgi:hypothetical protein
VLNVIHCVAEDVLRLCVCEDASIGIGISYRHDEIGLAQITGLINLRLPMQLSFLYPSRNLIRNFRSDQTNAGSSINKLSRLSFGHFGSAHHHTGATL